jgi:hypothetical protein
MIKFLQIQIAQRILIGKISTITPENNKALSDMDKLTDEAIAMIKKLVDEK